LKDSEKYWWLWPILTVLFVVFALSFAAFKSEQMEERRLSNYKEPQESAYSAWMKIHPDKQVTFQE
jgi:hypothetical protein